MKTLISLLVLPVLLFVGCMNSSSDPTSSEVEISQQSNSANWIELPADLGQDFAVETVYSSEKIINGKNGGTIKLDVVIPRPGNSLGDFEVHAKVNVQKNSFAENENRTFTVTLDPEYCIINLTPSPNTLDKQLVVDLFVEGVDVSQVNPDTFGFIFVGDNSQIMETESDNLQLNVEENWFKVRKAIIIAPTDQTPGGARYGFAR
ncbi:hypothetical protein ACFLQ4_00485 [Bacteroidota bacterium]|jgi:hypothetical protein